jgi:hypothetical protein
MRISLPKTPFEDGQKLEVASREFMPGAGYPGAHGAMPFVYMSLDICNKFTKVGRVRECAKVGWQKHGLLRTGRFLAFAHDSPIVDHERWCDWAGAVGSIAMAPAKVVKMVSEYLLKCSTGSIFLTGSHRWLRDLSCSRAIGFRHQLCSHDASLLCRSEPVVTR